MANYGNDQNYWDGAQAQGQNQNQDYNFEIPEFGQDL